MTEKKVQKRTIENREKIMNAAWQLFCEKGYFNTNTKEIAKLAGVAIGSFYNYFNDKMAIYYELLKRYLGGSVDAITQLEELLFQMDDHKKAMQTYIFSQMDRASATGRFFSDCQVLIQDNEPLKKIFNDDTKEVLKAIEELLHKIPGVKKRASYTVMARILFIMVDSLAEDACALENKGNYKEYREQMTEIVHNYVFGE